ncbi:MAG: class I SAM-dependent methyltransferase [Solirubrobacterales bacterium]|nr:class I SAM-dependent methyltransferase [Solirubrobacterales bacterium]
MREQSLRPLGGWIVRLLARLVDPVALRIAGLRAEPVPPRRLRARSGAAPARAFAEGGRIAADELAAALASAGRELSDAEAVLDLGCGAGRVLPHVARRAAAGARCVGCDVDPAAIEWLRSHQRQFEWKLTGAKPPLPFEDSSFDLVYSISVLSHLDESGQDRWLAEVARILRPGAVALLTIHGQFAFEQFRTGRVRTSWVPSPAFERERLGPMEFVFEPYVRSFWNRGELPGVESAYGLAFHGPEYVQERWSQTLEVVAIRERAISAWQDVVVARREA